MKTSPLADWDRWLAELETERVSHTGESRQQLLSRLELERPESPRSQYVRSWSETKAAQYWVSHQFGVRVAPAPLPPAPKKRLRRPQPEWDFTDRQMEIAVQVMTSKRKANR